MHAGNEHNAFESMLCIKGKNEGDLIKLVEHSGDLKPDDQQLVPTQQCFVALEDEQVFSICFKFAKRSPDKHDFLVILKLDGQAVHKGYIMNAGNKLQQVDRIFTYTQNQAGRIQANALKVSEMEQLRSTTRDFDMGKIELEVYRGAIHDSVAEESLVVGFKAATKLPSLRDKGAAGELCVHLGEVLEEDVDPSAAAIKKTFTQLQRDRGEPWFKQVYKYRMLVDLTREDRLTSDPNANVVMAVRPKKRRKTAQRRSTAGDDPLTNKVQVLEAEVAGLKRKVQTLQTQFDTLTRSAQPFAPRPSSFQPSMMSPPMTPAAAEEIRQRLHAVHAETRSMTAGSSAVLWRPGSR